MKRRLLLKGFGGAVLALPWLEQFQARASAAYDGESRLLVAFAGSSHPPNSLVVPSQAGASYTLPRAMASLQSVRQHVSVVSGLRVPWSGLRGSSEVPPAGRVATFHHSSVGPLITGTRGRNEHISAEGPSAEQIAVAETAPTTRFPFLSYRVQPSRYTGGNGGNTLSWNAQGRAIDPIASPRLAYEQIFSGFVPPDSSDAQARRDLLRRNHSVIDFVADRAGRLQSRLGRADRQRLDEHFTHVRALEQRLSAIPEVPNRCAIPSHPGEDPATSTLEVGNATVGYSGEDERGAVFADLIHMAFVCDQSRFVSWMITFPQSFMNAQPVVGIQAELHNLSHGAGSDEDWVDGNSWEKKHFGSLVNKLAQSMEGDRSLLDKTAMVFLQEGGFGFDPEGGADNSGHSTENMIAIFAGNSSRLKAGQHIVAAGRHPAEVTLSAMRSIGLTSNLGDLSSPIDDLFV